MTVPGPDTLTWTVDDDLDDLMRFDGVTHSRPVSGSLSDPDKWRALVADVRAARAHERCGPATDTLRPLIEELCQELSGQPFSSPTLTRLRVALGWDDLLVDGGGDG